jgi:hypothetical protein
MRVVLDHARIALDGRPVRGAADGHRVGDRHGHLRVRPDVFELPAEEGRGGHVDALPVIERDERVGDRAAVCVDDGQLADEGDLEQSLDWFGKGCHGDRGSCRCFLRATRL